MAQLRWKKDVAYIVRYAAGKCKWIKLGKIAKSQARDIHRRYEADIAYQNAGQAVPESNISFEEVKGEYLTNAKKAPTTIAGEKSRLNIICGIIGKVPICAVDRAVITNYKEARKKISNTSMNKDLRAIRLVLRYAFDKGYISTERHREIKLPPEDRVPPNHFDPKLLPKLLAKMDEYTRARIEVLYYMGLRPAELYRMETDHIDLKHNLLQIPRTKGGTQHTYRVVPIPAILKPLISRLLKSRIEAREGKGKILQISWIPREKNEKFLFCRHDGSQLTSMRGIQEGLKSALKAAGITHRITLYTFRHQFATTLLLKTRDIRSIQELLGHRNMNTTQRYAHVLMGQLKKTIDML